MVPVIDLTKVFLCMCDRAYSFLAELFQRKGQTLVTTFILSSELFFPQRYLNIAQTFLSPVRQTLFTRNVYFVFNDTNLTF